MQAGYQANLKTWSRSLSAQIREEFSLQSPYRLHSRSLLFTTANGCSIGDCNWVQHRNYFPSTLSKKKTWMRHFPDPWEQTLAARRNKHQRNMLKMAGSCNITRLHQLMMRLLTILVNCRWTACGWRTVISSLQHRCGRKWSNVWKNKEYWWRLREQNTGSKRRFGHFNPRPRPKYTRSCSNVQCYCWGKNIFPTWRCERRWRQHTRCQFLHKCLIWGSHLDANTVSSSTSEVEGVTVSAASFFSFLSSCFTPPPSHRAYYFIIPERCCLIWAENLPEFPASHTSCAARSSCATQRCVHACDIQKKREIIH